MKFALIIKTGIHNCATVMYCSQHHRGYNDDNCVDISRTYNWANNDDHRGGNDNIQWTDVDDGNYDTKYANSNQSLARIFIFFFTEFTDASMTLQTMLAWVSTGFPRNAYCHNWPSLNFTASDSSSDERCFLKASIAPQLTQLVGSKFQLLITLFENAHFPIFSLHLFLNSFWPCPLLSPPSSWKNTSELISYFLLTVLKISVRSLLILRPFNRCKSNCFSLQL